MFCPLRATRIDLVVRDGENLKRITTETAQDNVLLVIDTLHAGAAGNNIDVECPCRPFIALVR